MHNHDWALNNEFSSIKFSLGLLGLEKTLGYLHMVRDLHEIHLEDLHSSNDTSLLNEISHALANELGICHQGRFFGSEFAFVRELGTNTSKHFETLVLDKFLWVLNIVVGRNCIHYLVIDDGWNIHGSSLYVRDWWSLELKCLNSCGDIMSPNATLLGVHEASWIRPCPDHLPKSCENPCSLDI